MIRGLAASGLQSVSLPTTDGEICRTRHIYTCQTLRNGCSRCAGIFAAAVQAELACRTWRHLQPRGLIVLPPLSSFALPPSPPFSRGTPVALPPSLSSLPPPPRPSGASANPPAVALGKTLLTCFTQGGRSNIEKPCFNQLRIRGILENAGRRGGSDLDGMVSCTRAKTLYPAL